MGRRPAKTKPELLDEALVTSLLFSPIQNPARPPVRGWRFAMVLSIAMWSMSICLAHAGSETASIVDFKYVGMPKDAGDPSRFYADSDTQPALPDALIEVRYKYDGSQGQAYMGAKAVSPDGAEGSYYERPISPGNNGVQKLDIIKPFTPSQIQTKTIEIFIYTKDDATHFNKNLVTKTVDWVIAWPEARVRIQAPQQSKESFHKHLLADAVDIIDHHGRAGDFEVAKNNLDKIILEDPANSQAYLELARIAMKSDPDASEKQSYPGLVEAQRLIKVALKFNPSYANSYILLGYVLAIQHRTDEAIAAFTEAKNIGTKNLWLYYNWGFALELDHRTDAAIGKYREGLALMPVAETSENASTNRAIPAMFSHLTAIFYNKDDVPALDAVYQQRLARLDESCEKTFYGELKLYRMGDYDTAILWGTRALQQNCRSGARPLLAAAYLTKWALDTSPTSAKERETLLDRGQAFITDTQKTIVDIASSPLTAKALPKLKGAGFEIDGKDAKGLTPLAYAAAQGKSDAVQELIRAGANPDVVLEQGWTPLMIATAANHADVVNVLLNAHVNVARKSGDGSSAMSIAKNMGNDPIVKLLGNRSRL
jgi:tetratricopeptide (TPR) repeat protein